MSEIAVTLGAVVLAAFCLFYSYAGACVIGYAKPGPDRWLAGSALLLLGAACGYGFLLVAQP